MKNIKKTILLLLFSSVIYSQEIIDKNFDEEIEDVEEIEDLKSLLDYDCKNYIKTEYDKVTGISNTGSKRKLVISDSGKYGFGIFMMLSSETIILSINTVGSGRCIDKDDRMYVLFRNGSRLSLPHNGKFNCKSTFYAYFGGNFGKEQQLNQLMSKEIEIMRIETSKGHVEKTFTKKQSEDFMRTITCLKYSIQ